MGLSPTPQFPGSVAGPGSLPHFAPTSPVPHHYPLPTHSHSLALPFTPEGQGKLGAERVEQAGTHTVKPEARKGLFWRG